MNQDELRPLQMSADEMRELGYRVVDRLVDRYESLADAPAWQGATRAELDALLREPAPERGTPCGDVLERLFRDVLPRTARIDHPRFMAFVPGAPTWPGVLGDLIASGTNVFQGTWLASAGVSELELVVLEWFCRWVGLPDSAGGLLVSGGSAANLMAIACARHAHPERAAQGAIYCSTETHSSVMRAVHTLGFDAAQLRLIAVDEHDRIDMAALQQTMERDRSDGRPPFMVVANGGSTSTGAVDALRDAADMCARFGAWLHVDAAYGGFAVLTARGRTALRGIERADSIALDPHKWLYQPFEAGCLLVRDAALLDAAFHVLPPYLQDTALPAAAAAGSVAPRRLPVNFADRGVQLTRSARVLKLWLSIQTFGTDAFRDAIDQCMDLALHAETRIRGSAALELITPARLGIICFRRTAPDSCDVDAVNHRLLRQLLESGFAMISSTRVRDTFALRLCILNYRTSARDVDAVIDWLESAPVV